MALWAFYGSRGHGPRVRESEMKPAGKPDARNGHVRFDERGWETGRPLASVPAPILDSTCDLQAVNKRPEKVSKWHSGALLE